ncbi:hypothetical protein [Streptomyces xinghaiensis]|uniref:hypothetical protein n=1 Tax=Streptomyces xinghaiensis TaxID=1038928 RepID=UPI00031A1795|nr:hypothetical protein [Streptomyces xinghaiensis]MZE80342.1 hypothetical protein [Streptomyces sp. SID5475]
MTDTGNLLLRWASELGSGTVTDLKKGAAWLARSNGLEVEFGAAGRWIRDCQSLGHLDVDWKAGRWSVAPSALTRLPSADGLAAVVGSRTAFADERLANAEAEELSVIRVPSSLPDTDIPVPDTWLVQYDDPSVLPGKAGMLGAVYTECFAIQAAAMLPELRLGRPSAPPAYGRAVERYDQDSVPPVFVPAPKHEGDGLYRFRQADHRRICTIKRGGDWYETSQERGIYLELARLGGDGAPIRWYPERGAGRERMGRLVVDWGTPLPDLQRRVAVMCTALPPEFGMTAKTVIYHNVPRAVAERIAASLSQRLGDEND